MELSDFFNKKVLKGAAKGAGIAFVGAIILPVISVSWPVVLIGAGIGGRRAYNKKKGLKKG